MPLVSPADLLHGARPRTSVAGFNIILIEHLEAFVSAAEQVSQGVILQLSQNAVRYHGALAPIGAAILQAARDARVPIAVQLDHADDIGLIREAVDAGFTSVMFDASRLGYEANVSETEAMADELHRFGVWVEAELGEIGGKDGVHSATARTDPEEAARFVAATGVDGLAVAVGSSHAMQSRTAVIDLDLVRSIRARVDVPLVLHGSSGVSDERVRDACAAGIRKVNVGTRFNTVLTQAVRECLNASDDVTDPRVYLDSGRRAMTTEAVHLLETVGGASSTNAGRHGRPSTGCPVPRVTR